MKYRDGGGTYTVKSGDTFNAIAYANGVTPAELVAANPKISADNLSIGQVLTIPNATQVTEVAETPTNADNIYLRQAYAESSFRPKVIKGEIDSPVGALGLVQIMPSTVKEMKKLGLVSKDFDPLDPKQAVVGQAAYMNWIAERPYLNKGEDSVKQAKFLGAYNTGVGNIKSALTKAKAAGVDIYKTLDWVDSKYLPKETVNYINRITGKNDQFNLDFDKAVSDTTNKYILDLYNKKYGGPHDPPEVKQRKGSRKNYDNKEWTPSGLQFPTSVSSHLMKAEYVDDIDPSTGKPVGWVGFPSLFQDSKPYANDQDNWVQTSEDNGWGPIYEEAKRRGEVYNFGEDKEAALAFGEGSWKDQLPDEGVEVELSDEEVEEYRAGGYILEEMHEGGEPGHTHKNPAQWWKDVKGTPSKTTKEQIKLDKDLEESILNDNYFPYGSFENPDLSPWLEEGQWGETSEEYTAAMPQTIEDVQAAVDYFKNWYSKRKELPQFSDVAQKRLELINHPFLSPMHVRVRPLKSMKDFEPTSSFYQPRNFSNLNSNNPIHYDGKVITSPSYDYVSRDGAKSLLVHEMTHLFDDFVPQPGTSGAVHSTLEGKNIPLLDPSGPLLKEKILNDIVPESYRKSKPKNMKERQWNHATSSKTEIRAGLNQWRLRNNIDPLKNYSVKEIEDIIKNDKEKHGELYNFLRYDPELLKKLNDAYVKNEETSNTLDDQYAQLGGSIEAELTDEEVEQYKAGGYVLEELVDGGEDDLLTYKNDKKLIDGVADWQSQSDVNITSSYNDQIKARLLTGNYGYNPKSGELVKLSKDKQTKITDSYATQTLNTLKGKDQKRNVSVAIPKEDSYNPNFIVKDSRGNDMDVSQFQGQSVKMTPAEATAYRKAQVGKNAPIAQQQLNNVFGAAAAFTPPGAAILGMYGATKLLVDSGPKLINNPGSLKNWGNAALDALISTPITKGPAKFMRNLYTGKNTTILNQSNLPFTFRYKNHKGNIDIGLGASEYNLTNYKPLVQGTTGSGQWAVATKPLQFIKTLKPASTPGPLTAVSTATKKPLTLYPSLGGNPFVVPSARYTFPQYMRNDFDIDYTTGARISNSKAITPENFFNPDPKSTIQGMSQDKGYVFDPESTASNSVQPKNVGTSFKSLLENGAVTKIAKDGMVLTKEALGIIAKESVPHLKIPRIEQELIKRYGSIPEKVSLDELKDIANSTAVPMNIQVSGKKNKVNGEVRYETPAAISGNYGNPTYGYSSIGFNDPVITDDAMGEFDGMNDLEARTYLDDLNKKYVGEDQTFKNEYNTLGQKENETRSLLQNTNTQISEINSQVMLTKDLEVRQALLPKLETLTSESTFLTQQLDNIIKTKKVLTAKADEATAKLRMRINAHDYHVTGVTPEFNVNTRTLTFSNKERLPGYGTTSHDTPEGTMGHVYITERNTEPNILYVTQRQSDASQTKTFSERNLAEKFGKEKFARILARVRADISTHLDKNTEGVVEAASDWNHVVDALKMGRPYEDYKIELENLEKIIGKPVFSDEGLAKTSSATPTASYTKMVDALPDAKAYQKTNQDRMIQETINWASQNGYVEVRFPTAETATNIQAYGSYLADPKLTSWKEVDGKIMYGVPSDPDAYLNLVTNIPDMSVSAPYDGSMTLVTHLDVTKNKATIPTKNLSEADRFNLATMLNKEKTSINKTQVSIIPLYEQLGITRAISKSDKPLWEYVQKTDSNGKPIKGKEFKSDFYTEEQVIKFKEVFNGGKRKLDHYKQSKKDNISPYEHENRYMLLPEDKYKLMQEYEDIGKILKKTYPNAQIDKVIQDGNVWWNIKLPEDVLKGKRPIIAYKLGGSVEAELSLKDVQKYIDGGYVLEEIN